VDNRAQRHELTKQRIIDAAWQLSRDRGLTGWSLRDLGAKVGMRAPSLYVYFPGKDALYDEMFAQGNRALLAAWAEELASDAPAGQRLRSGAHKFFDFAVADPARLQLMFLRVIPSFEPSSASMALAGRVLDAVTAALAEVGPADQHVVDLWTAVITGLAVQQVSNDPGGRRWADLVDTAIDRLLASAG